MLLIHFHQVTSSNAFSIYRACQFVNRFKRLEKEFYEKVSAVSDEAMEAKRKKKEKKVTKTLDNLEECKKHNGPLTSKDIDRINELTDEQVLLEAKYLKKTISPNL